MKQIILIFLYIIVIILSVIPVIPALATPPATITYQGYLSNSSGAPVNAPVAMIFSLYANPTGGAPLWSEYQGSVNVISGVYSALMGSVIPINLPFDTLYYLGVTVNSDLEMMPRQELSTVPYAFRSTTADKLSQVCNDGEFLKYNASTASWNCTPVTLSQGAVGPQGVPGATGAAGPKGIAGLVGAIGPQGQIGLNGPAGPTGLAGPVGSIGATGATGVNGTAGAQGPQGIAGINAINGLDGKTMLNNSGDPVTTSAAGVIGDFYLDTTNNVLYGPKVGADWSGLVGVSVIGPVGPQGTQGNQGVPGTTGATGVAGPQGSQGVAGPVGPAGPQGVAGASGAAGVIGVNGANGINGINGADGKTVLSGTGAPLDVSGSNGDFYIDTVANSIYGPKVAGAWPVGVPLVGTIGATGAAGAVGAQGIQGIQGIKGDTGNSGAVGATGTTGVQGVTGNNGTNGLDGKTVLNGVIPPIAGNGVDGDYFIDSVANMIYGPKGAGVWPVGGSLVGLQGIQGIQGNVGIQGIQGNIGATGLQGSQGFAGASPFTLAGSDAVYTAGSVGIGTTTPSSLLSVGATSQFQVTGSGNVTAGPSLSLVNGASNLQLTNNGVDAKITTSAGNIELGTTGNLELASGVGIVAANWSVNAAGMINGSADGVGTKVVAGPVSDGSFTSTPFNGLTAVDSTTGRIYYRYSGAWHYVAQTGGFQIPNYEVAPSDQLSAGALAGAAKALPYEKTNHPLYLTKIMQPGDLLVPYADSYLPDGSVHGLYARFDDVKGAMFAEVNQKLERQDAEISELRKQLDELKELIKRGGDFGSKGK